MLQRYKNKLIAGGLFLLKYVPFKKPNITNPPQLLQGTNHNYQKFIVFGHQRSGSNMIINTLREHPHIVAFRELFVRSRISFYVDGYDNHSIKLLYLRNKYPIDFLERYIFSSYRKDIKAVGFKLFPDQLNTNNFRCLWQWIKHKQDIKIILLTRHNLLAAYTSLLIARKTEKFGIKNVSERTNATVAIDPEKCIAEFQKRKKYNKMIRECVKHHEVMEVTYENLIADLSARFRQLQEFLTVDVQELQVSTVQQNVRPLSQIITNYNELRQHLLGTEWKYCLEE